MYVCLRKTLTAIQSLVRLSDWGGLKFITGLTSLTHSLSLILSLSLSKHTANIPNDGVTWSGSINEEQITMIKTSISKLLSFIHSFVQADNGGHVVKTEVGKVVVRCMKGVAIVNATLVVRTSKG